MKPETSLPSEITEEDVREQLGRIIASPVFRTSKRCVTFLEYVVHAAVEGRSASLKEKALGIRVFNRDPDYDPKQDSVVRVTANDVRKRLAQYYGLGHQSELRIDLPPGSYLPDFHSPAEHTAIHGDLVPHSADARKPKPRQTIWLRLLLLTIGAAAVVAILTFAIRRSEGARSVVDQFWAPMLEGTEPVLLCVGQPRAYNLLEPLDTEIPKFHEQAHSAPAAKRSDVISIDPNKIVPMFDRYVALGDAMCLSDMAGLFTRRNRGYFIRGGGSTSFADLRESPAVLIGAFTNDWTLRLMGELRFTLERNGDLGSPHVHDRLNPSKRDWQLVNEWPDWKMPADYAIVSRVLDPMTGKMVVSAAGITQYGTAAAGEFLTKAKYLQIALRQAPRDWTRKNIQFVLRTRVIQGTAGPPQVLATQFW